MRSGPFVQEHPCLLGLVSRAPSELLTRGLKLPRFLICSTPEPSEFKSRESWVEQFVDFYMLEPVQTPRNFAPSNSEVIGVFELFLVLGADYFVIMILLR